MDPDGMLGHLPFSCACHASLDAHVSIQDVGKDGGDQTPVRPLTAKRPAVRPPSMFGARPARYARLCGHRTARAFPVTRTCRSNRHTQEWNRQATPGGGWHGRAHAGSPRCRSRHAEMGGRSRPRPQAPDRHRRSGRPWCNCKAASDLQNRRRAHWKGDFVCIHPRCLMGTRGSASTPAAPRRCPQPSPSRRPRRRGEARPPRPGTSDSPLPKLKPREPSKPLLRCPGGLHYTHLGHFLWVDVLANGPSPLRA